MKKNKKGFTLIELLAVIVILAIIALIATPIIMNMISKAKKNAAKSSSLGFIDSVEYYSGFAQAQSAGGMGDLGYSVSAPTVEIVCKKESKNAAWIDAANTATTETNKMCDDFLKAVEQKTKGKIPEEAQISLDESGKVKSTSWLKMSGYYCVYRKNNITKCTKTKPSNAKVASEITAEDEIDDSDDSSGNSGTSGTGGTGGTGGTSGTGESTNSQVTYKCKKSTQEQLHTETCNGSCQSNYQGGTIITYGNAPGNSLVAGNAYNCDVNGDGTYDSTTERFYYVADVNSSTAALIYYTNVGASSVAYWQAPANLNTAEGPNIRNYEGPTKAITALPTTSSWSNVSLSNTSRTIKNELNGTQTYNMFNIVSPFSYSEYAARLITTQEVESACGITVSASSSGGVSGTLNNCEYLMENTKYTNFSSNPNGYLTETPVSSQYDKVFVVHGTSNGVYSLLGANDGTGTDVGVRPVIEVAKSDIEQ